MKNFNQINLEGNLIKNPELEYTPTGKEVCTFCIANNRDYFDIKKSYLFNIVTWGKLALVCNKFLKKGSRTLISGELNIDKGTNGKYYTKIKANEVHFLTPKNQSGETKKQTADLQIDKMNEEFANVNPVDDDNPF